MFLFPLKGVAKDETTKEGAPYTAVAMQLESMQKHLSSLKLEDTLGSELVGTLTDPQGALLKYVILFFHCLLINCNTDYICHWF